MEQNEDKVEEFLNRAVHNVFANSDQSNMSYRDAITKAARETGVKDARRG